MRDLPRGKTEACQLVLHKRLLAIGLVLPLALAVLGFLGVAWQIVSFGNQSDDSHADAAVVLGAATWGKKPSPVYRERIKEAIALYQSGRVQYLVFTGGTPVADYPAEGQVGREFAIEHGVPAAAILVEATSRTTWQNLVNAKELMGSFGVKSVLLVSDPLHMRRAMAMASRLGLHAMPAPTSSSRFQSISSRAGFLWRETWLYLDFVVLGNPT
jgi:uncharacterized SAM-binding protein YcdF (DUF218 family)